MPGTLYIRRKRKGQGHGARNHKHASGNGLVRFYYGSMQAQLNPRTPEGQAAGKNKMKWLDREKRDKANRRKQ